MATIVGTVMLRRKTLRMELPSHMLDIPWRVFIVAQQLIFNSYASFIWTLYLNIFVTKELRNMIFVSLCMQYPFSCHYLFDISSFIWEAIYLVCHKKYKNLVNILSFFILFCVAAPFLKVEPDIVRCLPYISLVGTVTCLAKKRKRRKTLRMGLPSLCWISLEGVLRCLMVNIWWLCELHLDSISWHILLPRENSHSRILQCFSADTICLISVMVLYGLLRCFASLTCFLIC